MRITIVYDNESTKDNLREDWGFACIIDAYDKRILFDTGASGEILLTNMKKLNIAPESIDEIFISHNHWDHTGGLNDFLSIHLCTVYVPPSYAISESPSNFAAIDKPTCLHENFYSSGELQNVEQSLFINTTNGLVVVVGCSHSGVGNILQSARDIGTPIALIGGLHDFDEYDVLKDRVLSYGVRNFVKDMSYGSFFRVITLWRNNHDKPSRSRRSLQTLPRETETCTLP